MSIEGISSIRSPSALSDALALGSVARETSPVHDTLAEAGPITAANWTPERPILTSPGDMPPPDRVGMMSEYRLLAATNESRELGNKITETLGLRLQNVKQKIREISADNIEKLRENARRAADSSFWSVLKKIATSLLAAVSIVFGISLIATGGGALIGGAMIASGVLSLANFAMSESGAWEWVANQLARDNEDLRNKLTWILPGAVGILAGGIGLVGSIQGIASGAIQFMEKTMYVLQTAVSLFDAATTVGKGIADARQLWSEADLYKIQGDLTVERNKFDTVMREVEGSMNEFRAVKQKTKKIIQTLSQSNVQLVRQA
jgi:hypothetical protein